MRSGTARSRIAKPLLTSLGSVTLLGASTFVVMAVSSTGSMRPWDWGRADPAAAVGRYQACDHQGLGAIGCMLSPGFRPAAAAGPATAPSAAQPVITVATVQDPISTARPIVSRPVKSPVKGTGTNTGISAGRTATPAPAASPSPHPSHEPNDD